MEPDFSDLGSWVRTIARHSLERADIDQLLRLPYRIVELPREALLVRAGDRATQCHVLLSGFIYRYRRTGNGARQILPLHLEGDLVDFRDAMLGIAHDNLKALTDIKVAVLDAEEIASVALASQPLARALWAEAALSHSLLSEWMLCIGARTARQRVAHLICEMALRQERAGMSNSGRCRWPLTQAQLAEMAGITPVHANRTLQKLRADRLIRTSQREMIILDPEGLRAAGDFTADHLRPALPGPAPAASMNRSGMAAVA